MRLDPDRTASEVCPSGGCRIPLLAKLLPNLKLPRNLPALFLREITKPMAEYYLVDPTEVEVSPCHVVIRGQCPRCKAFWSEREDQSCDCPVSEEQADGNLDEWELWARRKLIEVIKSLSV